MRTLLDPMVNDKTTVTSLLCLWTRQSKPELSCKNFGYIVLEVKHLSVLFV